MPIERFTFHHSCELARSASLDSVTVHKGTGRGHRFRAFFWRWIVISSKNPLSQLYYRSISEIRQLQIEQREQGLWLIHPLSKFRLFYEMWMGLVLTVSIVIVPLNAGFNTNFDFMPLTWADYILGGFCLVDIVFNFVTGYVDESQRTAVMDWNKIFWNYIFGYFIVDLLTSLPYSLSTVIRISHMLKIIRYWTAIKYVERTAEYFNLKSTLFDVFVTIGFTLILFHWTACVLFLTPVLRNLAQDFYDKEAWIFLWGDLLEYDIVIRYINSLYKSCGTLLCIRMEVRKFGPPEEWLCAIFIYLIGKVIVTFLTVKMVQQIMVTKALETKYHEIIRQVEYFLVQKRISKEVRVRILQFYNYKYNQTFFKENKIYNILSDALRKEVNAENLKKLSNTVEIFTKIPQSQLEDVLSNLRLEIFMPNDVIIKAGSAPDFMYFLSSGTVSIYSPSGKEICHLHDGSYFGEICMTLKQETRRTATVIALEICEVYKLTKKGLKSMLKNSPMVSRMVEAEATDRLETIQLFEELYLKQMFAAGAVKQKTHKI